jgi:hypothetical protein
MVTDCMEKDDSLKAKLRQLGVELLSDMHKLSTLSPLDRRSKLSSSLALTGEIISFMEIARTMVFISEMNSSILKRGFEALMKSLEEENSKDKHFTFTLDEEMFLVDDRETDTTTLSQIKDKRTPFNHKSFTNNNSESPVKSHSSSNLSVQEKQERTTKIIELIKDKNEVSIKDISIAFSGCSEKTIQRELNSLVSKGQVKKTGSKRWSKYKLA